jgi:prevent-host-death family protein
MLTSRTFNQDTGRAKKASSSGPVFITDRGKPSHVLLSIRDYRKISGRKKTLADLLAMPGKTSGDMEIPISRELARSADLS